MNAPKLMGPAELIAHRSNMLMIRGVIGRENGGFPDRPEIITLVGSTRFKDDHLAVMASLTLEGVIVIPCGLYGHADAVKWPKIEDQKADLDRLHFRKIDASDSVMVINSYTTLCAYCRTPVAFAKSCETCSGVVRYNGPYVGPSSRNEISYAIGTGKRIYWLNPEHALPPDALPKFDPSWLTSEKIARE
jgi:hypothetical protein